MTAQKKNHDVRILIARTHERYLIRSTSIFEYIISLSSFKMHEDMISDVAKRSNHVTVVVIHDLCRRLPDVTF